MLVRKYIKDRIFLLGFNEAFNGDLSKILMLHSLFEKHIFDDKTQLYYIIMVITSETSVSIYVFILSCLFFFAIRILITILISSNSSLKTILFSIFHFNKKKKNLYINREYTHNYDYKKNDIFFLFNLLFKMIRYTSFNNRLTLVFVVV